MLSCQVLEDVFAGRSAEKFKLFCNLIETQVEPNILSGELPPVNAPHRQLMWPTAQPGALDQITIATPVLGSIDRSMHARAARSHALYR